MVVAGSVGVVDAVGAGGIEGAVRIEVEAVVARNVEGHPVVDSCNTAVDAVNAVVGSCRE